MSVESLLLIVLLIVLPLLERLVRLLRERTSGPDRHDRPDRRSPSRPLPAESPSPANAGGTSVITKQGSERARATPAPPPLPQHAARERPTSREPTAARRVPPPRIRTVTVGRPASPPRPALTRRPFDVADLRRGIVLTAVLGPCRALQSADQLDRPW
jgi:hypothetical protein